VTGACSLIGLVLALCIARLPLDGFEPGAGDRRPARTTRR